MMMSEFIERTGFQPMPQEYAKIEEAYYNFDGDKDAFCRAFVKQDGERKVYQARAAEIDRLNSRILEMDRSAKKEGEEYERRLADLQAELDKELEWKPSKTTGTQMDQARYEELRTSGRELSDQEARELIADECGFDVDKIKIIPTVCTYEVNKYSRLRKAAEYDRAPAYESTDWNYIRFDCAQFMYEYINGELNFYYC